MTDPVTLTPLTPLVAPDIQPYQSYLPTAFSDDLSLLQKMNFLINYLTTVTTTVNNALTTVNGFAAEIDTDVINQLNTWKGDGTLNTLINETILGSKAAIVVSATAPTTPDTETFWFKVV